MDGPLWPRSWRKERRFDYERSNLRSGFSILLNPLSDFASLTRPLEQRQWPRRGSIRFRRNNVICRAKAVFYVIASRNLFQVLFHQQPSKHGQHSSPQNRIYETGPRFFVYNSQILCLTEKSYLTTGDMDGSELTRSPTSPFLGNLTKKATP